jgi:hypothetical protein
MVKVEQKLGLLVRGNTTKLSILKSRNKYQAGTQVLGGGLHPTSTPKRIDLCRKADQRGLRKSSSLTNGTGPVRNKTALGEYAKGGPRSFLLCKSLSMRPSWATPLMRSV